MVHVKHITLVVKLDIKLPCKVKFTWLYDAYILVKGTTIVADTRMQAAPNNRNKKIFKNCVAFTDFISEISNTEIDHVKKIDVLMPLRKSIDYSENYLKTSGSLWQYYRD